VYMKVDKGRATLVATDSYRLSEYVVSGNIKANDIACIIPSKVLEELSAVLGGQKTDRTDKKSDKTKEQKETEVPDSQSIQITLSTQQIEIKIGHTTLLSRLIDGKFPDYQQIIPKDHKSTVTLSTKELTMVVKRMHYFAKEINNNLTFTFSKSGAHITTPQTQSGKDEATLAGKVTGGDNKIALSSSYILDLLSHTESEEIELQLTDSLHPALFHIPGNDQYLHLIMPLRIQEDA
jgi:DNA polymerase III subunit beta